VVSATIVEPISSSVLGILTSPQVMTRLEISLLGPWPSGNYARLKPYGPWFKSQRCNIEEVHAQQVVNDEDMRSRQYVEDLTQARGYPLRRSGSFSCRRLR
jgi:hypothetical protein